MHSITGKLMTFVAMSRMFCATDMSVTAELPVLGQYVHVQTWDNSSVKVSDGGSETVALASSRQH
jgi:chorismate-pyruvate lyase